MQTQNLIAENNSFSCANTQDVLKRFKKRHKFAKQQQLSNNVTCTSIYTDDVDICFMFNVVHNNTTYVVMFMQIIITVTLAAMFTTVVVCKLLHKF